MNAELLVHNIAAHWVQSGALVMTGLIVLQLLRLPQPRHRLAALHLMLGSIVLLPLIQPWQPVQPAASSALVNFGTGEFFVTVAHDPSTWWQSDATYAIVVVVSGTALRLLWLFAGVIRLRRIRAKACEIDSPQAATELESRLGVTARYFEHGGNAGPATFGLLAATVLLPPAFGSLNTATQQAVICHELLHVKRRDAAATLLEEAVVAGLWFHPWMWWLRDRIRTEREHVVDRLVVSHTRDRSAYVRSLVEMSGHDLVPHLSAGMSQVRRLRARIDAILDEKTISRRQVIIRIAALVVLGCGAAALGGWAVPLRARDQLAAPDATVQRSAVRRQPSSLPRTVRVPAMDYPQEALEKGIGGLVVIDLRISATGDVTAADVVAGPEELRAAALKAALGLKFEPRERAIALQVVVTYTIRSDSTGVHMSWADARSSRAVGGRRMPRQNNATAVVSEQNAITQDVRPPKKIKDVAPQYPAVALAAKEQGAVVLEASVDARGRVIDTRVLQSIPLLDQAARDAVMQWAYEPTVVDGIPVPATVTVTVNFTLREPENTQ